MPVKKRLPKGRAHRITPEAVDAFRAKDWHGLHRALGLKPWQANPLDVESGEKLDPISDNSAFSASLWIAQELRIELEKMSK